MRFYAVIALLVGGTVGGYRLSETYRQLDEFHREYLESPRADGHHATLPPLR